MKWHHMIKADDGTANFFLVTILEIPKRYLNHIDYEKKELSDLIDEYSEKIDEELFENIMEKIRSANSVYERMQNLEDSEQRNIGFDNSTQMYDAQKRLYEEAISILMDYLYKQHEKDNPEPEPEPEKEPEPHKSKKFPNTGDWKRNLRIIQRNRTKGRAKPARSGRRSKRGGGSGYGGALMGHKNAPSGASMRNFVCSQCNHIRALRNRHMTDSGQPICDYCRNSNKRREEAGKPKEASGGTAGFNPSKKRKRIK